MDRSREPCPDRILDDVGGAFAMGAVGGSAFHFLKGIYHSPRGDRLVGGTQAVRMNAGRVGGGFAVWGGLFSTFDCSLVYLRQKEDPWNSIIAGAATGGFLQMRQGLRPASRSALFGGVLLALIEGAGIVINKMVATQMDVPQFEEPVLGYSLPVNGEGSSSESSSSSSSWLEGFSVERRRKRRLQAVAKLRSWRVLILHSHQPLITSDSSVDWLDRYSF